MNDGHFAANASYSWCEEEPVESLGDHLVPMAFISIEDLVLCKDYPSDDYFSSETFLSVSQLIAFRSTSQADLVESLRVQSESYLLQEALPGLWSDWSK